MLSATVCGAAHRHRFDCLHLDPEQQALLLAGRFRRPTEHPSNAFAACRDSRSLIPYPYLGGFKSPAGS